VLSTLYAINATLNANSAALDLISAPCLFRRGLAE
jgi:hypothetical protein